MKYCGIDLHSNNSVVSVIDDEDHVVAEKRLPNDLEKIIGLMKPWQAELAGVVVESTFNWYWLVDGLKEAGFTVWILHSCCTNLVMCEEVHHASRRYVRHR
jgi:transposase